MSPRPEKKVASEPRRYVRTRYRGGEVELTTMCPIGPLAAGPGGQHVHQHRRCHASRAGEASFCLPEAGPMRLPGGQSEGRRQRGEG